MPVGPLQAMLDDPDDSVRATVIELLGERAPLEKLIDEITEGERHRAYAANSSAYRVALDVLSQLTERSPLDEPTKTDIGDDRVLDATMQSIYLRKILPVIEVSRRESSREELVEALYDTDEEHSKAAVFLLGRLQEWTAITAFFTSLRSGTHGYLRAIALSLLRRIGEQVPATVFVAAMDDRYSQTRLEAVRALEGLEEQLPQESFAVVALLDDPRRAMTQQIDVWNSWENGSQQTRWHRFSIMKKMLCALMLYASSANMPPLLSLSRYFRIETRKYEL